MTCPCRSSSKFGNTESGSQSFPSQGIPHGLPPLMHWGLFPGKHFFIFASGRILELSAKFKRREEKPSCWSPLGDEKCSLSFRILLIILLSGLLQKLLSIWTLLRHSQYKRAKFHARGNFGFEFGRITYCQRLLLCDHLLFDCLTKCEAEGER